MTIKASNFPTTRPTLNLDFAKTKQLDPRVTFSRASSGTYVDVNGVIQTAPSGVARFDQNPATGESLGLLVEEARTNLLTYSQRIGAGWTTTNLNGSLRQNASVAPDGTFTATAWIENSGSAVHDIEKSSATGRHGYSVFVKEMPGSAKRYLALGLRYGGDEQYRIFDASGDGAVSSQILGTRTVHLEGVTGTIQKLPDGWYRCTVTWTGADANLSGIHMQLVNNFTGNSANADGRVTYTGDGFSGLYIWGAQLEAGAFPTSYIPTPATFTSRASTATFYDANGIIQTAASGVARSDAFFPDSNGVMRSAGLLLEGAGTNLALRSEEFNDSAWNSSASFGSVAAVTSNAISAPNGTLTADLIQGQPSGQNVSRRMQEWTSSAVAGTTYTFSVFAKKSVSSGAIFSLDVFGSVSDQLTKWGTGNIYPNVGYNFDTNVVSTNTATGVVTATRLSGGWVRISISLKLLAIPAVPFFFCGWTSGAVTDDVYAWGAQLETGTYPTSYIPTTTATVTRAADVSSSATVTRSADVASITGANFSSWYRQDEGVIFAHIQRGDGNAAKVFAFGNTASASTNRIDTRHNNSFVNANSSTNLELGGSFSQSAFTSAKIAVAYKAGSYAKALNSTITGTSSQNSLPIGINRLIIGGIDDFDVSGMSARISRLTYWPTRLSDATLQTLTR